jgi:hypothetical protein
MQIQSRMTSAAVGSRRGLGCALAFAVPFTAIGLFALYSGLRVYGKEPNAIAGIIVGGVFTAIGLIMIGAALFGSKAAARQGELKAQYPDKPWMWRDDWARGVINDSNKASSVGLWFFAIVWNGFSFPVAILSRRQFPAGEWLPYLIFLFPLVGVFILIGAIYNTLRAMKFGTSQCHLERVPIVPGRSFRGHIVLNSEASPADGYRVRLSSLRYTTTGTGKNRSTSERQLWDTQVVVPEAAAMRSPMGTRIPFQFATPPDAQVTDERNSNDRYVWKIAATAELPGVDYFAQFDVPVFQTGEVADGTEFTAYEEKHRAEAARLTIKAASGVVTTPLPGGGDEYRIDPKKTFMGVIQSIIFLGVWNGAIAAMIHFQAPWGIPAVFIVLDLLFLAAMFNYYFVKSAISVDRSGVRVRRYVVGSGSTKTYPADSIASIDGTTPGQSSKTFGVTLKLHDGTTTILSTALPDRESADIVAAKMMASLRGGTAGRRPVSSELPSS